MVRGRRPLRLRADHTRGVSRGLRRRPHRRLHPPPGTLPRHILPPGFLPPLPHPRRPLPPRQLTPSCFSFYTIRRSRSADFSPPKSRRGNLPAVVRIGCANSGTTGTGQKCQKTNFFRFLNICAPKPHQRWVPRSASSQSARLRRRAPLCGGRLACRAVAPLRVVKMRRRSLRSSFLRNYREAHSFSLRVDENG